MSLAEVAWDILSGRVDVASGLEFILSAPIPDVSSWAILAAVAAIAAWEIVRAVRPVRTAPKTWGCPE